jgi:hypothetical protein
MGWSVCDEVEVVGTWCREQDLNLHAFRHTVLSRARLPIPPSRLGKSTVAGCGMDFNTAHWTKHYG